MGAQHTKGPWKLLGRMKVIAGEGSKAQTIANVETLACIGGHDDSAAQRACDQEQANARLIAAAPELLAALQAVANLQAEPGVITTGKPLVYAMNIVHTAIAKATAA